MATTPSLPTSSVPLLRTSVVYTDAKIDKNLGNYKEWFRHARHYLTLTGLISYALGTTRVPDPSELSAFENWQSNDSLAHALIPLTLSKDEWDFAEPIQGAKACWDALCCVIRMRGRSTRYNYCRMPWAFNAPRSVHLLLQPPKFGRLSLARLKW